MFFSRIYPVEFIEKYVSLRRVYFVYFSHYGSVFRDRKYIARGSLSLHMKKARGRTGGGAKIWI